MEDGVSFVSPNGSFDQSNIVKGQVKESALNAVEVQDPTGAGDSSKRSSADAQLIRELRAANEQQAKQTEETRDMFLQAIEQLGAKFEKFEVQKTEPDEFVTEGRRKDSQTSNLSQPMNLKQCIKKAQRG